MRGSHGRRNQQNKRYTFSGRAEFCPSPLGLLNFCDILIFNFKIQILLLIGVIFSEHEKFSFLSQRGSFPGSRIESEGVPYPIQSFTKLINAPYLLKLFGEDPGADVLEPDNVLAFLTYQNSDLYIAESKTRT
jgi:hypothetical protein